MTNTDDELYTESFQSGTEENESNIGEQIFRYLRHWKWFVLSLVIAMSAGYFYVRSQVALYSIRTDILIKDSKTTADETVLQQLNINAPNTSIDNEILILKSLTLVEQVVDTLDLETSYFDKGHFKKRMLYKNAPATVKLLVPNSKSYGKEWSLQLLDSKRALFNGKPVAMNDTVQTDAGTLVITPATFLDKHLTYVTFNTVSAVAQQYINKLGVSPAAKGGNMLFIVTEDEVPQRGMDFLNTLVTEYMKASVEDKSQSIAQMLKFINDRLNDLAKELDVEESHVEDFKKQNNISDIDAQSTALFNRINTNDAQIQQVDLQLVILKNIERFLASPENADVTQPSMLGLQDQTVASMVSALGELKLKKQSLLRTVTENNPVVTTIDDQIISLKNSLHSTIPSVRSNLLTTRSELARQSSSFNVSLGNIPAKERGLINVMRQKTIKDNLFGFLLQKREETRLSLESTSSDSRIINKAVSSGAPIKPVKSTLYAIFFIIGIGIPFAIIFIKEFLNNTVRRKSDITKVTQVPILAQISHSVDTQPLVIVTDPRSMVSEQIRGLRTNLQFLASGKNSKVILFTSSISGEGKSYLSLNLGASLALAGQKVIILEFDLRKPKLLSTLNLQKNVGLSEYLIDKANYQDIVRPIPDAENFYLIESGTIPPNPAELLTKKSLGDLIEQLRKEYDYILIDAPPVGLVTDAQILSQHADITFFLVRHNFTLKKHITLLNEIFLKKVFKNINIIFNSVEQGGLGYGYGYGYRYDYSYYGESKSKPSFLQRILGLKKKSS
ncbi:GumC family protein [Mucilaginibacter lacusdianchii]|uniref:GumC family protein n=1 Tax=Mucilaginibacter lacusdianchii TaxID=2684211 RepID=UPI00131BFFE3|nr:tyrosine-protein kinase [Mucilaginibacter sp. JXJ CY 39]